jgi:hypothetical protein
MAGTGRSGLAALIAAALLLTLAVGSVQANPITYTASFCYDAGTKHIVIEQVWSGVEVDEVSTGIGNGQHGLGEDYPITASTSGDESSSLAAPNSAKIAGGSLYDQGTLVASQTISKPKGGWSRLPAC